MEPSVAVELAQNLDKSDAVLDVVIMDDDTTTIAKLKSEYSPEIVKWSDVNHAKKSLTSSLFKLAQNYKIVASGKITPIIHIKMC